MNKPTPQLITEEYAASPFTYLVNVPELRRNYKLFFGGQSLSLIGSWMTSVASSWLVYRLTNSPLLLGLVGFSGQIPAFLLTPLASVWVDRWNRHRVLKITQVLAMLQSFTASTRLHSSEWRHSAA